MEARIAVYCDSYGVSYESTKDRLINAGIATEDMFPSTKEAWRGNGLERDASEPLWSVQRTTNNCYKVKWGLFTEQETE